MVSRSVNLTTEVERRDVQSLALVEAMGVAALDARVRAAQAKVGFTSDYDAWIAKVTPPDLE